MTSHDQKPATTVNDHLMLVLFAPIDRFPVSGASSLHGPFIVLLYSVTVFILNPLVAGMLLRHVLIASRGRDWFEQGATGRGTGARAGAGAS